MSTNAQAYLKAMQPHTPYYHLDDEAVAAQLDKSAKHSKAAHKGQERKRQQRVKQQAGSEKRA